MTMISKRAVGSAAVLLAASALAETVLVRLGRTYGSAPQERAAELPGDDVVPRPDVVIDHAITRGSRRAHASGGAEESPVRGSS
jgi:hypothetical protein